MGGIAKQNRMKALAIGGIEDHVHLLLSLPFTTSISKAIQLIKGGASKWVHDTFAELRDFSWQEGYAAFTIGIAQLEDTIAYIEQQAEHHQQHSYQHEFLAFLRRHGIDYDPHYVLD
jgi:REP element-mobilizing transposase RayT